jgi:hypothetical protein
MEIRQRHGGELTPQIVLDEARGTDHPLHQRFTWDDAEAAERYRREQAHQLIRSVKISYIKRDGNIDNVRAFQAIRGPSGYVYEPSEEVVRNDIASRILKQEMLRDWLQMRKRWESFDEFWVMIRQDADTA